MASYSVVKVKYIDSTIRERQTDSREPLKPQLSEAAGFLIHAEQDRIEIARELFADGNYLEVRGTLAIPRCAIVGKIKTLE